MRHISAAVLIVLTLALAACGGGGDDDDDPTPTLAPIATAEPTEIVPSDEIRSIDLESEPAIASFIDEMNGTYVQTNVLYADVTGDGVEEAVVPLSSDGTLGDVALIVVTPDGEGVSEILAVDAREFGIAARVDDGTLVTTEPVPGPDDPFCCPSQIRTTTYAGDGGTGLTEASSVVAPNPSSEPTPAEGGE